MGGKKPIGEHPSRGHLQRRFTGITRRGGHTHRNYIDIKLDDNENVPVIQEFSLFSQFDISPDRFCILNNKNIDKDDINLKDDKIDTITSFQNIFHDNIYSSTNMNSIDNITTNSQLYDSNISHLNHHHHSSGNNNNNINNINSNNNINGLNNMNNSLNHQSQSQINLNNLNFNLPNINNTTTATATNSSSTIPSLTSSMNSIPIPLPLPLPIPGTNSNNQIEILQMTIYHLSTALERLEFQFYTAMNNIYCYGVPTSSPQNQNSSNSSQQEETTNQSLKRINERLSTLEGRQKIIQSKISQLDNLYGQNTQSWGKSIKKILESGSVNYLEKDNIKSDIQQSQQLPLNSPNSRNNTNNNNSNTNNNNQNIDNQNNNDSCNVHSNNKLSESNHLDSSIQSPITAITPACISTPHSSSSSLSTQQETDVYTLKDRIKTPSPALPQTNTLNNMNYQLQQYPQRTYSPSVSSSNNYHDNPELT